LASQPIAVSETPYRWEATVVTGVKASQIIWAAAPHERERRDYAPTALFFHIILPSW
jgi:hypothetical protein